MPVISSSPSLCLSLCLSPSSIPLAVAGVCVFPAGVCVLTQNARVQESRAGFSGSVSIPSITKNRAEPGRSMSASSGLGIREYTHTHTHTTDAHTCMHTYTCNPSPSPSRFLVPERQCAAQGAVWRQLQLQEADHDLSLRELAVVRGGHGRVQRRPPVPVRQRGESPLPHPAAALTNIQMLLTNAELNGIHTPCSWRRW